MKTPPAINRKGHLAFASAILTLLIVGAISYRATVLSSFSDDWVRHTGAVLEKLQELTVAIETGESSYRGYLLTADPFYLKAYQDTLTKTKSLEDSLRSLTIDNVDQQQRLSVVETLASRRIRQRETTIELRRSSGFAAALATFQISVEDPFPGQFQTALQDLKEQELHLLEVRQDQSKTRLHQAKTVLALGTLFTFLLACAAWWSKRTDHSRQELVTEELEVSEERYRLLLEGIKDYAIFALDPLGKIISWNAGAERISAYKADEVVGENFSLFFPTNDVADGRLEELLRVTALHGRREEEGICVRKDGSRFLASVALTALKDSEGTLSGYSVISRDLTESKESEARYRGLLEAAPDAMVVVNRSGNIVLLNIQAEKKFGYHRDELVGQPVKNIIPQGFAERLIADETRTATEALAQQIGTGIELIALRKDGSEFPIELMLSPLESAEDILVTAAIRDISVRKAAEVHLAQMESRYRGLLEAAPDAMVVVNQEGAIVLLNVQAEKQFGYRRDELVGQAVTNIIPEGFAERIIADGTRSAAEALAQQIGTGIELIACRKDGSQFPIEIMLSPLESQEGILVTAAIRDISVRNAAELHLAQMESRYRGLLEAAPDAMVVVNQEGAIVLLNVQAEKQFGYLRDELLGQKMTNIIPEGFAERIIADGTRSADDALAQKIGTGIELIARRKDGSEFPIEIMLSPLISPEGTLVTTAIRDISVRKDAEAHLLHKVEQLNRSNEELGHFAYIASHDLQEPLRMVASYTQLLARRYKGRLDSDADEFIAFAVDGASRMQRLIKDLLTFSRVETMGKQPLVISSEEALNQSLRNLRGAIEGSGAVITYGPLPTVLADETQLIQLFQNLVANGIKYHTTGIPRVHISAHLDVAKKWEFSVKDNGMGIDSQYFEKIFGMFQRLHKREEFDGTGIGLAICKKIVERHGGVLSVQSELQHGSTFSFSLQGGKAA